MSGVAPDLETDRVPPDHLDRGSGVNRWIEGSRGPHLAAQAHRAVRVEQIDCTPERAGDDIGGRRK